MKKLKGIYNKQTGKERFWSKVNIKGRNDCWNWLAGKVPAGYGVFWINGSNRYAHRVAWELYNRKKIPEDKDVLHACDNPSCCNPLHLWLGTDEDNIRDKVNKGRQASGENNGRSKLTNKKVIRIRKYYSTGDYTQKSLADFFGVSRGLIGFIIRNVNWKHI